MKSKQKVDSQKGVKEMNKSKRAKPVHGVFIPFDDKAKSLVAKLSPRQLQVFKLLIDGFWTKEIAAMLDVSEKTIEKYRSMLTTRMGVYSYELISLAIRAGLKTDLRLRREREER